MVVDVVRARFHALRRIPSVSEYLADTESDGWPERRVLELSTLTGFLFRYVHYSRHALFVTPSSMSVRPVSADVFATRDLSVVASLFPIPDRCPEEGPYPVVYFIPSWKKFYVDLPSVVLCDGGRCNFYSHDFLGGYRRYYGHLSISDSRLRDLVGLKRATGSEYSVSDEYIGVPEMPRYLKSMRREQDRILASFSRRYARKAIGNYIRKKIGLSKST